jgi:hypothetical protein
MAARCFESLGRLLTEAGRPDEAAPTLRVARELYAALGMRTAAARIIASA